MSTTERTWQQQDGRLDIGTVVSLRYEHKGDQDQVVATVVDVDVVPDRLCAPSGTPEILVDVHGDVGAVDLLPGVDVLLKVWPATDDVRLVVARTDAREERQFATLCDLTTGVKP